MTDPNTTPTPDDASTQPKPPMSPMPATPQPGVQPESAAPAYGQPDPAYGQHAASNYGTPTPNYGQPANYGAPAQPYVNGYYQQAPGYGNPNTGNPANDGAYTAGTANPYGQQPTQQYVQPQPANGAASGSVVPLNKPYYGCPPREAFLRFWKKYATFKGRASRSEYWWWVLFAFIIGVVLDIITDNGQNSLGFLTTIWSLATLVPGLALCVRRLHDINKPGWWMAIFAGAAFIGGIVAGIGGGAAILAGIGAVGSSYGYYSSGFGPAAMGGFIAVGIAGLIILATVIVCIVFMALPSKPEGARFDDDYVAPNGTTANFNNGTAATTPYANNTPYTQPYDQTYGQPAAPTYAAGKPEQPVYGQGQPNAGLSSAPSAYGQTAPTNGPATDDGQNQKPWQGQ